MPAIPLILLNAATTSVTGAVVDAGDLKDEAAVEVTTTGTITFSVQVQQSLDGENFANLGSALTAVTSDTVLTNVLGRYFRATLTISGTGTVTTKLAVSKQ